MQKHHGSILYSATDLANYLECPHLTNLDRIHLDTPLPQAPDDPQAEIIIARGMKHEADYLARLKTQGADLVEIPTRGNALPERAAATRQAIEGGAEHIYQATFLDDTFLGLADFLRRVPRPDRSAGFGYEVVDTKLARSPRARFLIQICCYAELLGQVQGALPHQVHLALGDGTEHNYRLADYIHYYHSVKERFLEHVSRPTDATYPEQCAHCDQCRWRELCQERWTADDHLNQVANITRPQIRKLHAQGITTLAQLAELPEDVAIPDMTAATRRKLTRQARLQQAKRDTGRDRYELLPQEAGQGRGLARLPQLDPADLFFDMEGDPFEPEGLEYLFGVWFIENGEPQFKAFWAHNRVEERRAFEEFMDFVTARRAAHPNLHVYHYAHYEETALKRLMCRYGTRENAVDDLLRSGVLVDLYQVVREALQVSEPRYSIKNMETFYMGKRQGEVTSAVGSVVFYEHWRETGDPKLLEQILEYNREDCRSLQLLLQWLWSIYPPELRQTASTAGEAPPDPKEQEAAARRAEAEAEIFRLEQPLRAGLPEDPATWDATHHGRELAALLLNFHRREAKPAWWALFARREMEEQDLRDDLECIAGLERDPAHPPVLEKRSLIHTYRFPPQEFKLVVGDSCKRVDTLEGAGTLVTLDENAGLLQLKLGKDRELPDQMAITGTGPIDTSVLQEAIRRFARDLIAGSGHYPAVQGILEKRLPRLQGRAPGQPIINETQDPLPQVIRAVSALDGSHLFIQGPPGAGKTYVGSHVIVDLLRQGKRVGVASNSHKAINHLLGAVEKRAEEIQFTFQGLKKSTNPDTEYDGRMIRNISRKEEALEQGIQLLAGTAWFFADEGLDQALDYLFVDEAGQVSLANLVAMGTSAKNIVLLGDQMQLGQPLQGVHPGRSGESALDYLLDGQATIPPEQGVFLATTWRMHPGVCQFISDAVYDGRLHPEPHNQNRQLVLSKNAHPVLLPAGIRFVPIDTEGCSQRSLEEAEVIQEIYASLLQQKVMTDVKKARPMTPDDILVVAPYNLQVNLLRDTLPEGARVGTVDKFQGQEAAVVIVSMATSSGDDLPRYMEFLYSKNRLNVAVSRAQCLAILVANPRLLAINCSTPEQMALVNTLCWLREYAGTS